MALTVGYNPLKHVLCDTKFASVSTVNCLNRKINMPYLHNVPVFAALEVKVWVDLWIDDLYCKRSFDMLAMMLPT